MIRAEQLNQGSVSTPELEISLESPLAWQGDEDKALLNPAPLFSIIIPAYNASQKICETLGNVERRMDSLERTLFDVVNQVDYQDKFSSITRKISQSFGSEVRTYPLVTAPKWYEIIVVNDGSRDETATIVEEISKRDQRINMVSYGTNMGKGYAIKSGIMNSRGKYIILMDGDGEISSQLLGAYISRLRSADIIIGSKYHPLSSIRVPASRRFLSRCFNLFVKSAIPLSVSDTQVGLKVGRADVFRKIFRCVLVKRYAFDVEVLAVAKLLGLRIEEMPVKIRLDAHFKKKEIARMALDVLAIAYRLRILKWYQRNIGAAESPYGAFGK